MHDHGDYKSGWQMKRDWDEAEKVRKLALKGGDDDDEDEEEDIEDDEDGLAFASFICRQPFVDPVVTKSKHYFCEHCALKIILDVPTVGGHLMLVDMAGSENIEQADAQCAIVFIGRIKRRYKRAGVISVPSKFDKVNGMQQWEDVVEVYGDKKVYEYMENGSLAQKLHSDMLDWGKRFDIAVGTAKGLAYLHEECLEWVLHCDVKPHNILLDSNCKPKVADFGLCKLLDRDGTHNTEFTVGHGNNERSWWKEDWIEEVVDFIVDGEYDINKMKILINVALRCLEEDMDARPTMTHL
ncbi:putative receptor protein kinase ZmPK1 [Tanacetum coccineum]